MWIIFEGMDKTGKTTLIKELGKQTSYKDILIDRGPAGYKFYDIIYNRLNEFYERKWNKQAKQIMFHNDTNDDDLKTLVIYLQVRDKIFVKRLREANEEEPNIKHMSYLKQESLYRNLCFEMYGEDNILIINTDEMTIDESIEEIKNRLGYVYY